MKEYRRVVEFCVANRKYVMYLDNNNKHFLYLSFLYLMYLLYCTFGILSSCQVAQSFANFFVQPANLGQHGALQPTARQCGKNKKSKLHLFALPHTLSIAHLLLSVKDLFLLLHQSLPLLLVLQACLPFSLLLLLVQHVLSVRCVSYTLQRLCLHTHIHAVHQSC